jgi:hypothetical protein
MAVVVSPLLALRAPAVILSEAKNPRSFLCFSGLRTTSEILRFAQDDTFRIPSHLPSRGDNAWPSEFLSPARGEVHPAKSVTRTPSPPMAPLPWLKGSSRDLNKRLCSLEVISVAPDKKSGRTHRRPTKIMTILRLDNALFLCYNPSVPCGKGRRREGVKKSSGQEVRVDISAGSRQLSKGGSLRASAVPRIAYLSWVRAISLITEAPGSPD